jgi:SAM-dependent MidA family methyltransferase
MSPRFGQALARQIAQALEATGVRQVWEFGAGSGALAEQILQALPHVTRYTIVDLSGSFRARQQQRLAAFMQAGLLVPVEEESLTTRATRSALAQIEANPECLLE